MPAAALTATPTQRWWQRGAIYQIYPRSFADSDGDGIGDLGGLVDRLDYLNDGSEQSLGVEAIWLSPFYPSPMVDFGYDVTDHCGIDPVFGELDDFDHLVAEAHRRGIKVIIDWVSNHTSDRHPWFAQARTSRGNPRRDWYVWRDPRQGGLPPNNWHSARAPVGPAWTFDPETGQYYLHSFVPQQPDLNWDNPRVRLALHDTLRFWLERGVDGFRLDAIHKIAKDPRLGDNASARHDQDWPTIHARLREVRSVVDEYQDRMIVGEVCLHDLGRMVRYLGQDQLHLVHNFSFASLPWSAPWFRRAVDDFESLAGDRGWPAWFLGNHDLPRIASRFGGDGLGEQRARLVCVLLYTLRGTPFIYQGDELGLPDAGIPPDRMVDADGRDPARAPLPWAPPSRSGPAAGFSAGTPWLPPVADAERLNVSTQALDPRSTLCLVRRLAWYRRGNPALRCGSYRSLDTAETVFAYVRQHDAERLLVVLNFDTAPVSIAPASSRGVVELSTDCERAGERVDLASLELAPHEGVVVRCA